MKLLRFAYGDVFNFDWFQYKIKLKGDVKMIKFTEVDDDRINAMIQREIDDATLWMPEIQNYESIDEAIEFVGTLETSRKHSIVNTYLEEAKLLLGHKLEVIVPERATSIARTYREKADLWENLTK